MLGLLSSGHRQREGEEVCGLFRGRSFRGTWRRIPAADPHRQAEAKDCLPDTGSITRDRPLREIFDSELELMS